MTTRSWPDAPAKKPPVTADRLAPTAAVTRMPPEAFVRTCPEPMVNVVASGVLKRRLLMACVFQATELLSCKSTFATPPGAVVPAIDAAYAVSPATGLSEALPALVAQVFPATVAYPPRM